MEHKLEMGPPSDITGRLEKEVRCYQLLDQLHVEYARCDHPDVNADTIEECRSVQEILQATICKNLFLCNRQQTQFYLLMIPGNKPFRTKELSGQLGVSRLSFAPAEKMAEFLDITPGSVSILGLMNDKNKQVRLLVDEDVLKGEYTGCHPCINTSSLRIRTVDLFGPILQAMGHEMTVVKLGTSEEKE